MMHHWNAEAQTLYRMVLGRLLKTILRYRCVYKTALSAARAKDGAGVVVVAGATVVVVGHVVVVVMGALVVVVGAGRAVGAGGTVALRVGPRPRLEAGIRLRQSRRRVGVRLYGRQRRCRHPAVGESANCRPSEPRRSVRRNSVELGEAPECAGRRGVSGVPQLGSGPGRGGLAHQPHGGLGPVHRVQPPPLLRPVVVLLLPRAELVALRRRPAESERPLQRPVQLPRPRGARGAGRRRLLDGAGQEAPRDHRRQGRGRGRGRSGTRARGAARGAQGAARRRQPFGWRGRARPVRDVHAELRLPEPEDLTT